MSESQSPVESEVKPESEETKKEVELEDWEVQLNQSKELGDNAFRNKDYPTAISHYTQALSLDPTHTILLSNRSAAHLANLEKSKALSDARQCIKSDPTFIKGYTRCASAVVSLGRYREGLDLYRKVLKDLDAENAIAKRGIEGCQNKIKQQHEWEMERTRKKMEARKKKEQEEQEEKEIVEQKLKEQSSTSQTNAENTKAEDDDDCGDDMDDFFSEIDNAVEETKTNPSLPTEESNTSAKPKEQAKSFQFDNSNLKSSQDQINYILQPSHKWLNLNPYHVLSITYSESQNPLCTIEKIEKRYRAVSLLIHPDKNLDNITQAELAFDEVKKAMTILRNEDRRHHTLQLIAQGIKIAKKTPIELPCTNETEWIEKNIKKVFAQVEQKRKEVEARKKKHEKREQNQELEEVQKLKKEKDFENKWKESGRVEKRIGNWRDFQNVGGSTSKKFRTK